jgi:hypothetical protein
MATIELEGRITDSGELQIGHLSGVRAGKVKVTITEIDEETDEVPWGERIVALLMADGGDTGGWAEIAIPDVVDWLQEQRREQWARRQLQWGEGE